MIYDAISLMQPYASLSVFGHKTIETRSRKAEGLKGRIVLIHASAGFPMIYKRLCYTEPFYECLVKHGYNPIKLEGRSYGGTFGLPVGAIIGRVKITEIRPTLDSYEMEKAKHSPQELAFGDYSPGRCLYFMGYPQWLIDPIPAKGAIMLPWHWEGEISEDQFLPHRST